MIDQYLTPGWITLGISLVGFISFYLGKLVLDFYPTQEDKALNYIIGFILFLTYILIPILFFYYFPSLIINLNWIWFFVFWVVYGLFAYYFKIKMDVFKIKRGKADQYFYEAYSKNISKFGFNSGNKLKLDNLFRDLFMELPNQLKVILLGYITIFLVVNLFFFFNNWVIKVFIVIATISTFNNIIVLHNARFIRYEDVSVVDIDGRKYKGRLIKQDNSYIILIDGKNVHKFSKENIKIIHRKIKPNIKKAEAFIDKLAQLYNLILLRLNKKRTS